ncbi:unnamed protein product [Ixodes persulcatus]
MVAIINISPKLNFVKSFEVQSTVTVSRGASPSTLLRVKL